MSMFDNFDAQDMGIYHGVTDAYGNGEIYHDGLLIQKVPQDIGADNAGNIVQVIHSDHTTDTYVNSALVSHSVENHAGGHDVYDAHGKLLHHSETNNAGDMNFYNGQMVLEGTSHLNADGNEDYLTFPGNGDEILAMDDPLAHASEMRFASFANVETV